MKLTFLGAVGTVTGSRISYTDYLLIESTYGDRLHEKTDPADEIG